MGKTYTIEYLQAVDKDLSKIDPPIKAKIRQAIEEKLSKRPEAFSFPLKNTLKNFRKLRVGSYRVVFSVENKKITVLMIAIGHRSEIYKKIQKRFS